MKMRGYKCIPIVLVFCLCALACFSHHIVHAEQTDAERFKKEYESLNGTKAKNGMEHRCVSITSDNPFVFVDAKRTTELISGDIGVLFIGANWCPWCRTLAPLLIENANEQNFEKIFYWNADEERNEYIIDDGMAMCVNQGSEGYHEMLELLADYLESYILKSGETLIDTGKKRIFFPTLLSFNNGKVCSFSLCTYPLEKGQTAYDLPTNEQIEMLANEIITALNAVR